MSTYKDIRREEHEKVSEIYKQYLLKRATIEEIIHSLNDKLNELSQQNIKDIREIQKSLDIKYKEIE